MNWYCILCTGQVRISVVKDNTCWALIHESYAVEEKDQETAEKRAVFTFVENHPAADKESIRLKVAKHTSKAEAEISCKMVIELAQIIAQMKYGEANIQTVTKSV
jgi:hypothetical protein